MLKLQEKSIELLVVQVSDQECVTFPCIGVAIDQRNILMCQAEEYLLDTSRVRVSNATVIYREMPSINSTS